MATRLGVVAGAGDLPQRIVEAAHAVGRPVFVVAIEGAADPGWVGQTPHTWIRLGQAGKGLALLRQSGVTDVVLAGGVKRPSLLSLRPDWRTAKFLAKIGRRALGDDGLLKAVIRELEEVEGFRVVGTESVLSVALVPAGPLGMIRPDDLAQRDMALGIQAARVLGAVDIGQAVVAQQGVVLAVEAAEGTDALLARAKGLAKEGPGGVLVKIAKPEQELRADLPTIGPTTVAGAKAAGLRGIAVQAGACLILDRDATAAAADAAGLFIFGVPVP